VEASEFTCAHCERIFRKAWTDDEAKAEAKELFGYEVPESERADLCDDCYAEFTQWVGTLTPQERAELDTEVLSQS